MTHGAGATVWRFTSLSLEEPFYRMKDSELCGYKVRGLAEDSFDAKYRCFPFFWSRAKHVNGYLYRQLALDIL